MNWSAQNSMNPFKHYQWINAYAKESLAVKIRCVVALLTLIDINNNTLMVLEEIHWIFIDPIHWFLKVHRRLDELMVPAKAVVRFVEWLHGEAFVCVSSVFLCTHSFSLSARQFVLVITLSLFLICSFSCQSYLFLGILLPCWFLA